MKKSLVFCCVCILLVSISLKSISLKDLFKGTNILAYAGNYSYRSQETDDEILVFLRLGIKNLQMKNIHISTDKNKFKLLVKKNLVDASINVVDRNFTANIKFADGSRSVISNMVSSKLLLKNASIEMQNGVLVIHFPKKAGKNADDEKGLSSNADHQLQVVETTGGITHIQAGNGTINQVIQRKKGANIVHICGNGNVVIGNVIQTP